MKLTILNYLIIVIVKEKIKNKLNKKIEYNIYIIYINTILYILYHGISTK